jgi:NAD(P)H-hydrate epimerase
MADSTCDALEKLLDTWRKPMVLDSDALNIISRYPKLRFKIPRGSVLTPHPGELRRLIGDWSSEEEKIAAVQELATDTGSIIVVKGAHTMICLPDGSLWFNSTGNPGMAKGGSGDVLTGFITGLVARGYTPAEAAVIGVYLHGKAGDKAAAYYGEEGMNSADMIDFLAEALLDTE